jgi:hypothetical protein
MPFHQPHYQGAGKTASGADPSTRKPGSDMDRAPLR